jgi:hypothetical protein
MTDVNALLDEREARYGAYEGMAAIAQQLKTALHMAPKWDFLAFDQKESLEMIVHKIGRILNGSPDYLDGWVDIAGYSQLIVNRLEKEQA